MKVHTAYKFDRAELKNVDVFGPAKYDPAQHGNEPWVDAFVYAAYKANNKELQVCVDARGTTDGDTDGINILILAEDLPAWNLAARLIGVQLKEANVPLQGGIFGDEDNQISLAQSNDTFYWIDETLSPAVALAKLGGSTKSTTKKQTSAENGKKGGRPKKQR